MPVIERIARSGEIMKSSIIAGVISALSLAAAPALAHDEKPGANAGKAHAHSAMHKEQQPWGIAGDAKAARRTIEISMSDTMRFSPEKIEVRQGETVRFVLKNRGKIMHEMVIGTRKALDDHAAMMVKFPNMEHEEPYMAHVAPDKSGGMIWQFNRAGDFEFACLIPGHFQAGMRGTIRVVPAAGVKK
jgi:uncharacterized cupredoxin-like copper-binding protein